MVELAEFTLFDLIPKAINQCFLFPGDACLKTSLIVYISFWEILDVVICVYFGCI